MSKNLLEARGTVLAAEATAKGPLKLWTRIIEGDIDGSSGHYPGDVLERDRGKFHAGVHMHLDHMSFWDRMEGSPGKLETLAGFLNSDAVYETHDGISGLYAEALVISQYSQFIKEVADNIGVSILAAASTEEGISPKSGQPMDIITGIEGVLSVDFVTHPGANGRILKTMGESAKRLWAPGFTALATKHPAIEAGIQKEKGKPMAELTEETAKGLESAISGLTSVLTAEAKARSDAAAAAEAAKADEKPAGEIDVAEAALTIGKALAESGLTESAQKQVIRDMKSGTPLAEAIKTQKDYAAELLAEANVVEGGAKVTRGFGELSLASFSAAKPAAESDNSWAADYGTGTSKKVAS